MRQRQSRRPAGNGNDGAQGKGTRQSQYITASAPHNADCVHSVISALDDLAERHADAWAGFERLANSLASRGIRWYHLPGASDLFGGLDKSCELAFRMRREIAESLEGRAA